MISLHTIDEIWNCKNPRLKPNKDYMVCEWNENDFYKALDGNHYLYPKAQEDNIFERRTRKKVWRKILKENE